MRLVYHGHAAVSLEVDGVRLLIDPYESGGFGGAIAYPPITGRVDAVVCTHEHLDHAAVHTLEGSPERVESGAFGPFSITRVALDHDEYGGRRRGGSVSALLVEAAGRRVAHLSDVGQSPEPGSYEGLVGADVLLVPVGGFYTIGAAQAWAWVRRLAPEVVVPIHDGSSACTLRGMRPAEVFGAWASGGLEPTRVRWLEWGGGELVVQENP